MPQHTQACDQPMRACTTAALIVLTALLPACTPAPQPDWSGYAEGEYVYVAAPIAGQLDQLPVQTGQQLSPGQALFALDAQLELAAQAEAQARLQAAVAQAQNTDKGRRPDELAVVQAQLEQARAQAVLAESTWQRQRALVRQGFISAAQLDNATADWQRAQAHVTELTSTLRVAALPARSDERNAAQAQVDSACQALHQAQWRVQQKQQHATVAGEVAEVFFRVGEYVPAGQPVLAVLPPTALKARFYVPEAELAQVWLGQPVLLSCDGCGPALAARISRIATGPEFTPPVIYSNAQRARLVYLVEARPDADSDNAHRLRPGQPLDVRPADKVTGKASSKAAAKGAP